MVTWVLSRLRWPAWFLDDERRAIVGDSGRDSREGHFKTGNRSMKELYAFEQLPMMKLPRPFEC